MKRLLPLLLLLFLPCLALADGLTLTPAPAALAYAFATDGDEFVLLTYTTPTESGSLTLYGAEGSFSGTLALPLSSAGGKVKVTVSSLAQRTLFTGSATLPASQEAASPQGSGKPSAKIRDLTLTETPQGLHYAFTAPGADNLTLQFKNKQQSGTMTIFPVDEDGRFEGDLPLPLTYARTLTTVTILNGSGKSQLAQEKARKGWAPAEAPERNPEGRLSGVVVCIDPGHQEVTQYVTEPNGPGLQGATTSKGGMAQGTYTQRREHIVTLEVAYLLRDELLRQGAEVVLTRTRVDEYVSNLDRCRLAEEGGADIMLRLHCDNRSGSPNKRGLSIHTPLHSDYAKAIGDAEEWRAMGNLLLSAMQAAVGYEQSSKTGNVSLSDKYVGNNWAKMPCFLVEMGYMTNVREDVLLSQPTYQKWLCEGMAQGVYDIAVHRGLIGQEGEE